MPLTLPSLSAVPVVRLDDPERLLLRRLVEQRAVLPERGHVLRKPLVGPCPGPEREDGDQEER
jgi:hypothetical protein